MHLNVHLVDMECLEWTNEEHVLSFIQINSLLFITRSKTRGGEFVLFVVAIVVDEDVVGEDASDTLVDDEEFDILFDTVVLVAMLIMIY